MVRLYNQKKEKKKKKKLMVKIQKMNMCVNQKKKKN